MRKGIPLAATDAVAIGAKPQITIPVLEDFAYKLAYLRSRFNRLVRAHSGFIAFDPKVS